MQIYLPDDLYAEVKSRKLPVSELLQGAIRAEIRREELILAMEEFLEDALHEFGEPSSEALGRAEDLAARIKAHLNPPVEEPDVQPGAHETKAS
ncbi:hypothetical protein GCM10009745_03170 [Kribbella yunnanensis]|uniref:CopG family transcriptional regulator n=2 Tax=Kribbella yunnanensis TaxID=190194 RepID=A0ABN2G3J3_9ACTN